MTIRLGLVGRHIQNSLSPVLHHAAARSVGMQIEYDLIDIEQESLNILIERLRRGDWLGLNVTAPYKKLVMPSLDEISADGARVSAINTIRHLGDGYLRGDNTDLLGFMVLVENHPWQSALVLGGGGAARVAVDVLSRISTGRITVANRTPERLQAIQSMEAKVLATCTFDEVQQTLDTYDLIVNCLPSGVFQTHFPLARVGGKPELRVVDLAYGRLSQELRSLCVEHKIEYRDGLDMLIMQGLRSFELWTDRQPDIEIVRESVFSAAFDQTRD